MAGRPNIPPPPADHLFAFHPQSSPESQPPPITNPQQNLGFPNSTSRFSEVSQLAAMPTQVRNGTSEQPPERPLIPPVPGTQAAQEQQSTSDSHSTSSTPSEQSSSDQEEVDEEGETRGQPRRPWIPIPEDTTIPCEDEIVYAQSRGEHCAVNDRFHFERQTFFDLDDSAFKVLECGRIDWVVERFNGTQEAPNTELIMRSGTVEIGGCDWRIKLFPHGNGTPFVSVYIENATMQSPGYQEFDEFVDPPFPRLEGHDYGELEIKKRRSVAAQVGVVMYNPDEPRTNELKMDAHQFSKATADYGWRYFFHRDDLPHRRHGQREALLRRDKIAFSAYIRVIEDPTRALWRHDRDTEYETSVLNTGLRPFAAQTPVIAGIIPLLHFKPFRDFVLGHTGPTQLAHYLKLLLWKLFSRTKSPHYGPCHGTTNGENEGVDCISFLRQVSRILKEEVYTPAAVEELIGDFDGENASAVRTNRLKTKNASSIQEAVNTVGIPLATPALLTLELERQGFDREKRRWNKLTNRVGIENVISVGQTEYHIHAVVTHCGHLTSGRHNVYVRPGIDDIWYGYEDCKVTAMTKKQAVSNHEGRDAASDSALKRRDSPLSGLEDFTEDTSEIIYAVMYVRRDCMNAVSPNGTETWAVPDSIREGIAWEDEYGPQNKSDEGNSDASSRAEQDRSESDLRLREQRETERLATEQTERVGTPDWPLTDEEGDVVMSDADSDDFGDYAENLAASTSLSQIPAIPSQGQKWFTTFDCLGRDYYQGYMLGSHYHGDGHLIAMNGDEYLGTFNQGQKSGPGKMIYAATGNIYEGAWLADQHHGHGKLTEKATGNVFEGGWQAGKKHGDFVLKGRVTEEERSCCTICYEREMTTAFYDCGHVIACKECASQLESCPICRRRVVGRLQIFGVRMSLE
ncbi:hypothetical protein B0A50_02075 [Salinomyces thailandicus]|uniref:RING-type domain-containing protein n=1 Tax=Salinomyces thailandicus TaxID=706561 RepID=A0A4U0U9H4_9PEZI|nr:hypothetical protein B0A50_02075 [Salinomyces thailandica]